MPILQNQKRIGGPIEQLKGHNGGILIRRDHFSASLEWFLNKYLELRFMKKEARRFNKREMEIIHLPFIGFFDRYTRGCRSTLSKDSTQVIGL